MRISDWSSDVCSSDLPQRADAAGNVVDVAELVGADAGEVLQMAVALVVVDAEPQLEAVRHRRVQHRLDAMHAEVATGTFEVARSEERRVGKYCVRTCKSRR